MHMYVFFFFRGRGRTCLFVLCMFPDYSEITLSIPVIIIITEWRYFRIGPIYISSKLIQYIFKNSAQKKKEYFIFNDFHQVT